MPYAIFDYMGAFLRSSFAHVDNVIPVIKTITWLLLSRLQGNKPHRNSPEPSEPCLRNLHQHAPELSRTLRNLPRPSGTNLSEPSGTYLLNLRQHKPEPSEIFRNLPVEPTPLYAGTLRNLPEPASGTYTILHWNSREPSGTRLPHAGTLRNLPEPASETYTTLHWNSPEPSGTRLRNLHQHTPELSRTFRNLPEPSCGPHPHTPELIWAEDCTSLRCWGKKTAFHLQTTSLLAPSSPTRLDIESRNQLAFGRDGHLIYSHWVHDIWWYGAPCSHHHLHRKDCKESSGDFQALLYNRRETKPTPGNIWIHLPAAQVASGSFGTATFKRVSLLSLRMPFLVRSGYSICKSREMKSTNSMDVLQQYRNILTVGQQCSKTFNTSPISSISGKCVRITTTNH